MAADEGEWVPLSKRPEWKDVVPVPEDTINQTVVAISYSPQFKELMDYFRAALRMGEISDRVFDLTTEVVKENPGNYTAWHLRRQLIRALNKDRKAELQMLNELIDDSPKNYQIWHHRQSMISDLGEIDDELEFTGNLLRGEDSKNYHCWSYRQWLLFHFNLWDSELEFTASLISSDCLNNSAWNQRFVILKHKGIFTDAELKEREVEFVKTVISKAPRNESVWTYLRGLYLGLNEDDREHITEGDFVKLKALCQSYSKDTIWAVEFLFDLYLAFGDKSNAIIQCKALEQKDYIRSKYWAYRRNLIAS